MGVYQQRATSATVGGDLLRLTLHLHVAVPLDPLANKLGKKLAHKSRKSRPAVLPAFSGW